ncbi:hypothetical protein GCM10018966_027840 [Streptomyces yanii]
MVSEAAEAFQDATEALAGVLPNGFHVRGAGGTLLAVTGPVIPALNVIMSVATAPDKAEIGLLCEKAQPHLQQLPWSIRLRGEADEALARSPSARGLTTRTQQPFMYRDPARVPAARSRPGGHRGGPEGRAGRRRPYGLYLHSSDEAVPLFEQVGFRTEESWTSFTA